MEHPAVNGRVVGSNPTRGVSLKNKKFRIFPFLSILFSVFVSLLMAEIFLRVFPSSFRANLERERYIRERNIIQSLFSEKDDDPTIGWHNIPNKKGEFSNREFRTTIRINSLGMRGPEVDLSEAHQRRFLVLGDSFTMGWGVEEEDTFVHLMNQAKKGWQFLNLGVSGFGTRSEAGLLEKIGKSLNPTDVLLVFYHNDAIESAFVEEFKIHPPRPYKGMERSYLYHFLRNNPFKKVFQKEPPPYYRGFNSKIWSTCETYLERIRLWSQKNKARLYIAYLPVRDEIGEPEPVGYRKKFMDYCKQKGIQTVDLTSAVQNLPHPESAYYRIDEHMTPQGHKVVSQALLKMVEGYKIKS